MATTKTPCVECDDSREIPDDDGTTLPCPWCTTEVASTKPLSRLDALVAILDVLASMGREDRLPVLESLKHIEFNCGSTGGLNELLGDVEPRGPLSIAK